MMEMDSDFLKLSLIGIAVCGIFVLAVQPSKPKAEQPARFETSVARSEPSLSYPESPVFPQDDVQDPDILREFETSSVVAPVTQPTPCEIWRNTHPNLAKQLSAGDVCYN